ncbi:uncharacterized protein LOC117342692 [Pecten maximus]|uniref:uncharacterized protein LOC117342692 n=1 Tax=Pecten maximus TaxID=6579 RepID=UPI001458DA74|nr:uncharacterized protein LOC117342692 [Pecten maximus]
MITTMAHQPRKYANVAPKLPGRERKPSACESCKCTNCNDYESCNSCSVVNDGYLRTVHDEKPPVPCRQRRFTDDFSPEVCFRESMIQEDTPKHDTKRMKELDIQLPLPNIPIDFQKPEPFQHKVRKPSDTLPIPNATATPQPPLHTQRADVEPEHVTTNKVEQGRLAQVDITLPRRKSESRKRRTRQPRKVHVWMKFGTIVSIVLLIGLSYMIFKSIRDICFAPYHYKSTSSRHKWNYSEPNESRLDTTICFSCDIIDKFKGEQSRFDLYGFKSTGNRRHCCLDQLGHMKWLVSMMKTNEILQDEVRDNSSTTVCPVKATLVPIQNGNKTDLKLNNTALQTHCRGASINVTKDALVTRKDGLYIVYMTMSVKLASRQTEGNGQHGNIALKAYLFCSKSKRGKCIEMETFNKTITYSDQNFHVFNLYTVKKFTNGEHFYPVLSEPGYLYTTTKGNFIGVVEL